MNSLPGSLRRSLALACLFAIAAPAAAAEYTFAVEPDYPPERAREIYQPLMNYLQKATGQTFKLVTAKNYHFYWRDIHATAKADFAFDEAHFADYRIKHDKYEPLVHTAEPTSYALVTSNADLAKKGAAGLVGHSIISMPSPSLGYVLLLEFYPNPVSQPDIRSSVASWRDALEPVFSGDVDAAMIPSALKDQYPNLIAVKTTRPFTGPCVTASDQVPADARQKVKDALLKLDPNGETAKVLLDLGMTKFVPASAKDYDGAERMLQNSLGY
ncbi:MAG TPA: PhnD/SsuA/transferrin family substrate-binding protein [Rudaea sp.]